MSFRSILILLLCSTAWGDIYVSSTGSGSTCSSSVPCSVSTGFGQFSSGSSTTIHFASGTYSTGFDVTKNGTSSGSPLTLQCDNGAASAISAQNQCKVTGTISFANIGIFVEANNVVVKGFDVGNNPNMGAGIIGANANTNVHILGNYVHDLAQNVYNTAHATPPGPGCPENGAIGAGSVGIQVNGNIVKNFGKWPKDSACHVSQGIYVLDGQVYNNLVTGVPVGGIQIAYACGSQVSNNVVISAGQGIIIENNNGCAGHNTTANNYIGAISSGGNAIFFLSGTAKCTSGNPNLFSHNITDGGVGVFSAGPFSCDTVTNAGTPVQSGSSFFVNYQLNGTGDYHLKSGSAGIGAGSTSCTSGGTSPCTPVNDIAGIAHGTLSVGVYSSTSAPNIPNPPSGLGVVVN